MRRLPARWRFPAIALLVLALGALSLGTGALTAPTADAAGNTAMVFPPFAGKITATRYSGNHAGNWGNPFDISPYYASEPVTFRGTGNVGLLYVQVGSSCEGGNSVTVHMWDWAGRPIGRVSYYHIYSEIPSGWYRPLPYFGYSVLKVGHVVTNGYRSASCWTGAHAHVAANGYPANLGVGAHVDGRHGLFVWGF